jgi:UDPglucose 6-dehydrogenase
MKRQTLTILGAGYVGLTTATIFAHSGYKVYLIEPDKERLAVIKQGRSFFYEDGLDEIIETAVTNGDLIPTNSYKNSIPKSSIVFSCVGTPDNPDGSSNLTYVFEAARQAAEYASAGTIYVQKSTVPVGTGKIIEAIFKDLEKAIDYVSNPEFLREGTAVYDMLFFDRIVAGGNDKMAIGKVLRTYMDLEQFREHIAHIARVPLGIRSDQYIATTLNSAELIKVTANAFLALKISFANSIALLADKADADVIEVMDAVGADNRIGRAFLNAGRGYGGGCFPKDVSGLISSGLSYGVDFEIMHAAQAVNEFMPGYIVDKLQDTISGTLAGKRVAVLGLAFKAGTSDVRRSPGVSIANKLKTAGAIVVTYDPQGQEDAASDLMSGINQAESIEQAIKDADITMITTEWDEFLNFPAENYAAGMSGSILFDTVNQYSSVAATTAGLSYIGVGHSV